MNAQAFSISNIFNIYYISSASVKPSNWGKTDFPWSQQLESKKSVFGIQQLRPLQVCVLLVVGELSIIRQDVTIH